MSNSGWRSQENLLRLVVKKDYQKLPTTECAVRDDCTRNIKSVRFHLEITKFGEFLRYAALIEKAYAKLVEQLLMRGKIAPAVMKDFVDWTHGDKKICKDEDGLLAQLIVTAILAHEYKFWNQSQSYEFLNLFQDQSDFLEYYRTAKEQCKKRLATPQERQKRENIKRRRITEN